MNLVNKLSTKGILAIDESTNSIHQKFDKYKIEKTKENRIGYRKSLVYGLPASIGGVILYDEVFQNDEIRELCKKNNIEIGIKVDEGLVEFEGDEKNTKGLNGLDKRLKEYKKKGAVFTKWRCVFKIGSVLPSNKLINRNTSDLAEYARIVVNNGMVPIVEPEILMEGNHTIEKYIEVAERIYTELFEKISLHDLPNVILKTGFATEGNKSGQPVSVEEIAEETVKLFERTIPKKIGGIVFLSGGINPVKSRELLAAVKSIKSNFDISFSFGRALQDESISFWQEDESKFLNKFLETYKKNRSANEGSFCG